MALDKDDKVEIALIVGNVIDEKVTPKLERLVGEVIDEKVMPKLKWLVGEVIDEKVTPRLKRLEEKSDATMEMCARNTEDLEIIKDDVSGLKKDVGTLKGDVSILKVDMKFVKEDVSDLQITSNRIESLNLKEIQYVDDLSGRVLKLETKKV